MKHILLLVIDSHANVGDYAQLDILSVKVDIATHSCQCVINKSPAYSHGQLSLCLPRTVNDTAILCFHTNTHPSPCVVGSQELQVAPAQMIWDQLQQCTKETIETMHCILSFTNMCIVQQAASFYVHILYCILLPSKYCLREVNHHWIFIRSLSVIHQYKHFISSWKSTSIHQSDKFKFNTCRRKLAHVCHLIYDVGPHRCGEQR